MASKPLLALWLLGGCAAEHTAPDTWPSQGCTTSQSDPGYTRERSWTVTAAGTSLAVSARFARGCQPAVLLTPGGLQPGLSLLTSPLAEALADAGIAVYSWDPPGRGQSDGEDDANGAQGQDALAGVLRWIAAAESVDPGAVALYTRSFGAALGAGALARHPDLRPHRWIDYEGPGWLEEDLAAAQASPRDQFQALADASEDPDAWFDDRSPARWVNQTTTPYHRLQGLPDHALGPRVAHAAAMLAGGTEPHLNGQPAPMPADEEWIQAQAIPGGLSYDGADAIPIVRDALGW